MKKPKLGRVPIKIQLDAASKRGYEAGFIDGRKSAQSAINNQVLESKIKLVNAVGQAAHALAHIIDDDSVAKFRL